MKNMIIIRMKKKLMIENMMIMNMEIKKIKQIKIIILMYLKKGKVLMIIIIIKQRMMNLKMKNMMIIQTIKTKIKMGKN